MERVEARVNEERPVGLPEESVFDERDRLGHDPGTMGRAVLALEYVMLEPQAVARHGNSGFLAHILALHLQPPPLRVVVRPGLV